MLAKCNFFDHTCVNLLRRQEDATFFAFRKLNAILKLCHCVLVVFLVRVSDIYLGQPKFSFFIHLYISDLQS